MNHALDRLIDLQLDRLAWLERDARKVRQWRAEDARNGNTWNTQGSVGCAKNEPADNK